jgi:hypothetical protein
MCVVQAETGLHGIVPQKKELFATITESLTLCTRLIHPQALNFLSDDQSTVNMRRLCTSPN